MEVWARTTKIIEAHQRPRTSFHFLLNLLFQQDRLSAVISMNVDGLEVMDSNTVPENWKHLEDSVPKWIRYQDPGFIPLRGTAISLRCGGCWNETRTPQSQEELATMREERCVCQAQQWYPDLINFSSNRRSAAGPKLRGAKDKSETPIWYEKKNYDRAISEGVNLGAIFIVGSSLSDVTLKRDITNMTGRGVRAFVITDEPSSDFLFSSNTTVIRAGAEEFAELVLRKFAESA